MFIFVVKPLGTCRGWGSSPSVALLSAPPEAQCAGTGRSHPVAPHGVTGAGAFFLLDRGAVSIAGTEGGPLEGTGLYSWLISNQRPFVSIRLHLHRYRQGQITKRGNKGGMERGGEEDEREEVRGRKGGNGGGCFYLTIT
ncbi:unnamed protein product [Pleuronectes platessa]|uniref:Uncharacterized protein n=1 Tax=Pleuronectes platessa TaxID=8262 RepID=A0A9N7ZCK9_PLEPL|nr:unnamed protein product [Pleuronectes platessa]